MSQSGYWIEFRKTGKNSDGAAVGRLTLFEGGQTVLVSQAFSGGFKGPRVVPIPNYDHYTIRLDIRGAVSSSDLWAAPDQPDVLQLRPFYGIQQIPEPSSVGFDARYEWGSIRACLNEKKGEIRDAYRGNYLHGKVRKGDYTHGCICERSELILQRLLALNHQKHSHIPVIVV